MVHLFRSTMKTVRYYRIKFTEREISVFQSEKEKHYLCKFVHRKKISERISR